MNNNSTTTDPSSGDKGQKYLQGMDNPTFTSDSNNHQNGGTVYTNGAVTNGFSSATNGTATVTNSEPVVKTSYADVPDEVRCGYGSCKPDWMQRFNNPKMFLFLLCWFSFLQGFVVNGVNNINTSSIERRFKLPGSKVGLISSAYDISAGIFVLPVTYFGTYAHQPRMITIAALVMSLGSFIMFLPHVTTGLYDYRSGATDVCMVNGNTTESCTDSPGGISNYLYMFMFGQFLHGYGGTVLYSVGIVFIDANVRTKDSPLYQGLLYCAASLGPAVGYLLGGYLLDTFVDFDAVDVSKLSITPNDVQWVGAWWIGFVITTLLIFLTVFFTIMPYARELPTAKKVAEFRVSQAHQDGAEVVASRDKFGKSLKDLPTSLILLLKNPVLMLATAASVTEGIVTSGFATFLAKFIQNQYGKTAAESAILAGLVVVPGAAGGNVMGGVVTRCANLKVRGMLRMCVVLCLVVVAISGVFFAKCPVTAIAGISVPYNSTNFGDLNTLNLNSPCNAACNCSTASYDPVCGDDKVQYFSPCHAACGSSKYVDGTLKFSDCACIMSNAPSRGATQRVCQEATCSLLYIFLPAFFFIIFFTFMAAVPTVSITLRCIPDIQRSFAIGLQWTFIRFLGTVPGPILFGFVFDKACLLWQEKCGEQGSCWIYDNVKLSFNLAILGMIVKFCSAIFYFLAFLVYKPPEEELAVDANNGKVKTALPRDNIPPDQPGVGIQNPGFEEYSGPAPKDMSTAL